MPELSRKQKKVLVIIGVTGGVYVSFRYFLPLVMPLVAAYMTALLLRPSAAWLEKKLQFEFLGRRFAVPIGVIGGAELLLFGVLAGIAVFYGGRRFFEQANLIINEVPKWIGSFDKWLNSMCRTVEVFCRLREGILVQAAGEILLGTAQAFKKVTMSNLVVNSVAAFSCCVRGIVVAAVYFIATVLSLQEMDDMRRRRHQSMFSREFALFSRRLVMSGNAWFRTQFVIMFVTACLCVTGLSLTGNPYSILLGIGIGILDALPVFGTGTVLIPWSLVLLFQKRWYEGLMIGGLFLICCLLREFLEARLMGGRMGLSPLETLAAIYVGLRLFGLLGMILGPIGLLIIEDLVEEYAGDDKEEEEKKKLCRNKREKEEIG